MVDLIERKRDGGRLTKAEFSFLLSGLVNGTIPDYQASAWCMAVYFSGLDDDETVAMTEAMVATGEVLDLSTLSRPVVDKHSTGGVGDKTTLVLGPILAAAGVALVKMSGRGLGHTGGTLDKLESIPGLRTSLSADALRAQGERIGLVIAGQTANLVPADKMLYALRDVTGTVPSLPLVAASVMAKKLAAGARSIALDVKYGSGALLPDPEDGRRLARLMRRIGEAAGRRVSVCLSSMEQPLGAAIGNAVEVCEAINTMRGGGPRDLRELCLDLAAELLFMARVVPDRENGMARATSVLDNGAALDKFAEMVEAQGGDAAVVERSDLLPTAKAMTVVASPCTAYLARMDTAGLGRVAMRLGAGRATKEDRIDPAAGLILSTRLGDHVTAGTPLAELYTNRLAEIEPAQRDFLACLGWAANPISPPPLFLIRPGGEI